MHVGAAAITAAETWTLSDLINFSRDYANNPDFIKKPLNKRIRVLPLEVTLEEGTKAIYTVNL